VFSLNPVRLVLGLVGAVLVRAGIIERERVEHSLDLASPRIVTGLARMSKSTADVAMVGIALGPAAIAGVGYAAPFWGSRSRSAAASRAGPSASSPSASAPVRTRNSPSP